MKSIPEISVDSTTLFRRLEKAQPGEVIAYHELSAMIGRDVRKAGYCNLTTARKRALSEHQMVFGAVANVGIKRLDDAETVSASQAQIGRSRTAATRARRYAATVDPNKLDAKQRLQYDAASLTAAVIELATKPSKQKALEAHIGASAERPPVKDILQLFRAGE